MSLAGSYTQWTKIYSTIKILKCHLFRGITWRVYIIIYFFRNWNITIRILSQILLNIQVLMSCIIFHSTFTNGCLDSNIDKPTYFVWVLINLNPWTLHPFIQMINMASWWKLSGCHYLNSSQYTENVWKQIDTFCSVFSK